MNVRSTPAATVAVAALLAASVLVPFVGVAGAVPDARVAVTDATVSPATPTAGAPITVEATVRLSAGSDSPADLDRLAVVDADGETVGEATGLGSLSPGETLTVPVSVTLDEVGEHDLTVVAEFSDDDDETATARRPLSLVVERGGPLVELDASEAVAGADSTVGVTVSNPTTAALRDLVVTVESPSDGERTRRTVATLAAGASQQLNFSVRPDEAGERPFRVAVEYTTAAGTRAETAHERAVVVDARSTDVGVRVDPAGDGGDGAGGGVGAAGLAGVIGGGGGGGALQPSGGGDGGSEDGTAVDVTVTNFGNAAVERVVLVPRGDNGTVVESIGRVAVADALAPGEAATATVDLSDVETAGTIRFVAEFVAAGERGEAAVGYDVRPERGAVDLTGMNVSVGEGGRVTLEGNLGNVGDGEVSGVVVGVADGEFARAAYPQRDYFVGSVGASEFAPFRVTARVDVANASTVPVAVSYTTGDDRIREVIEVPLPTGAGDASDAGSTAAIGGFGAVGGGLLVVGVAVPAAVAVLARRYR
ncbi:hypothetical protein Hbl1158_14340 [Halobaculum sp. CBA1158]|uniref:CARDB domain-containing protein n=1 Tax=Halobaculum sp. CBA1158 TaxID=2904243 RepID=UPI001F2639E6|nr:CARDB domain-containing protein [Halobaculum sp. CBA1158]UIO99685.1 hypothetical protein Hbl1158_14340 [Halobaculum sp. CBA1158]